MSTKICVDFAVRINDKCVAASHVSFVSENDCSPK